MPEGRDGGVPVEDLVRLLLAHLLLALLPWERPDGKAQVTVEYRDGKPHHLDTVVVSTQHDEMDISGYIGIQHHGEKGLLYKFRNLRIKDLGSGGEVYYPHREEAAKYGIAAVVQPGGSIRDDVVIEAVDALGLVMAYTGTT